MAGNTAPGHPDSLDAEIFDALAALITGLIGQAEQVAREFSVPPFFLKALHMLEDPMAMKDLGSRMRCDPSFITSVADRLEKHGLATREPDPADRRVKRIVLTAAGRDYRRRTQEEMLSRMPWRRTLDDGQRSCLLALVRAMLADLPAASRAPAPRVPEEVIADTAPPRGAGA